MARFAFMCLQHMGFNEFMNFFRLKIMAFIRAGLILTTLLFFFIVVTPFQMLAVRLNLPIAAFGQLALSRALLFLLRVKIDLVGSPSPVRPRLIVANHVSWVDILVFAAIEPVCFLAKHEVSTWPLIASFAKAQLTVFVDRKRRRSIPGANRAMAARMSEGRSVLLFPEGTTHDGRELGKFHSSHIAAARDLLARHHETDKVSIQPAALFYSAPHAGWTGDATLLPHLWEILKKPPLRVCVIFGAALAYERSSDRKILCAAAKHEISSLLETYRTISDQRYGSLLKDQPVATPCFETQVFGAAPQHEGM
jgi:1-acyl-sn-glycerol-3-phosphate acyltransferase